jgi:putative phosphoesterase
MKIGVISDTHNFFDPRLTRLFKGVDHILHAGDVGTSVILFQLEEIAPVTAVRGNNDDFLPLKDTEIARLGDRKYLLHHIVEHPRALREPLQSHVAKERPDVIVFGHTHKPFCQMFDGILYLNPGYAGKAQPGLERSIAILDWESGSARPKFLPL